MHKHNTENTEYFSIEFLQFFDAESVEGAKTLITEFLRFTGCKRSDE
jgi:hypothetical protein